MADMKCTIFNMTDREKGKLSIFTGGEWFKFAGKRAAYIYKMNDKIESQGSAIEAQEAEIKRLREMLTNMTYYASLIIDPKAHGTIKPTAAMQQLREAQAALKKGE